MQLFHLVPDSDSGSGYYNLLLRNGLASHALYGFYLIKHIWSICIMPKFKFEL